MIDAKYSAKQDKLETGASRRLLTLSIATHLHGRAPLNAALERGTPQKWDRETRESGAKLALRFQMEPIGVKNMELQTKKF